MRRKAAARRTAQKYRKSVLFVIKGLIILCNLWLFNTIWSNYYQEVAFYEKGYFVAWGSFVFVLGIFMLLYGGFQLGVLRRSELTYSMSLACAFTDAIMYLQFALISQRVLSPTPMVMLFGFQVILSVLLSALANRAYFFLYPARQIVLIYGDRESAEQFCEKVHLVRERYRIGDMAWEGEDKDHIYDLIDQYPSVLLVDCDVKFREDILSYCYDSNTRVYIVPSVSDIFIRGSHTTEIFDTPVLFCKNRGPTAEQMILKRGVDIVLSALTLALLSPVLLLIALAIKLYDGGPILFKQLRITRGERVFMLYKFRSMIPDADRDTDILMATQNDPRITPVGRFLRRFRLDEWPQLFNILRGDMSIVGPRPERVELVAEYENALPEFRYRHKMRAGLTGLAQVMGLYNTSPKDKLLFDLMYIEQYSLLQDFKLMFMTLKVLFIKGRTEGIAEDKKNAL